MKIVVSIPCFKRRIGQFDRDESHGGDAQVMLLPDGRVQIGGESDGFVFWLDEFLKAVDTLKSQCSSPT